MNFSTLLFIIVLSACGTGSRLAPTISTSDAMSETQELTEEQVMSMGRADSDLDGFSNNVDVCPAIANPGQIDRDGDGVGDLCDVCPTIAAPGYISGCLN